MFPQEPGAFFRRAFAVAVTLFVLGAAMAGCSDGKVVPQAVVVTNYVHAFQPDFALNSKVGKISFSVVDAGMLELPSGRIVARDAFVETDNRPFTVAVSPGQYAVRLAVAGFRHRDGQDDRRVAFAKIVFSTNAPRKWRMALVKGQNPGKLKNGEIFGYGVDSASGCFVDASVSKEIGDQLVDQERLNGFLKQFERKGTNTVSWCNWRVGKQANLIGFESGFGDGYYPSYFGYDDAEQVVELVTDFLVVEGLGGNP